ncbi:hypothetical protein JCM8208_002421 [Rhodotorula glutinis]
MSDAQSALDIAAAFLLQSPPGELADVYADLVPLVAPLLGPGPAGEARLEAALRPALAQYAREQLTVVELEGKGGKTLLSEASRVEREGEREGGGERHVAPRVGSEFEWDAVKATATSLSALSPSPDPDTEQLRGALDSLLQRYTANHYAEGVCAVFALDDPAYPASPPPPPAVAAPPSPPPADANANADAAPEPTEPTADDAHAAASSAAETADAAAAALPDEGVETANGEAAPPAAETAAAEAQAQTEGEGEGGAQPEQDKVEQEGDDAEMSAATPAAAASGEDDEVAAVPQQQEHEQEAVPAPAVARPSRLFGLYLVGNKYNPGNYWTGRWRSTYTLDWAKGTLEGTAKVNIHYYEQGNVQLSTTLKSTTPLPASPPAPAVLAALKASESSFQRQLGDTYSHLSDQAFKALRRALPKTRSKVDWDKAGAYRLGGQIGGAGQQAQA